MYINTSTLQEVSEQEIRNMFPNTSFSVPFIPPEPYKVLFQVPTPVYDWITQSVRKGTPVYTSKGNWEQTWEVVDLDAETIIQNRAKAADEMIKLCDKALTDHLDKTAQTKRYDNRITCMVRAGFAGPFQAEAQAFAIWADSCNAVAYQYLAEIQAGTRPVPDSPQELIDVLPPMVWPT